MVTVLPLIHILLQEPNVALTEIDMLHVKKDDIVDNATNITIIKPADNISDATKSVTE